MKGFQEAESPERRGVREEQSISAGNGSSDRKSFRCCILRTLLPLLTLKPSILSDLL